MGAYWGGSIFWILQGALEAMSRRKSHAQTFVRFSCSRTNPGMQRLQVLASWQWLRLGSLIAWWLAGSV